MVWTVRIGGQDAIVLTVSDAFLHMLLARVRDAEVKHLDPYRDATLDYRALVRWHAEIERIAAELREEVTARLAKTRRLPGDETSRKLVLHDWVERELSADEQFRALREVEAAVTLALESDGEIVAMGD